MKYAKLVKLGGELVEAKDVDHSDYYGGFVCPECGEIVFLRKAYQREGRPVSAAFVHHKAIEEISACEFRVGAYSSEYVQSVASKARDQRLAKLSISLWKYIKTTSAIDLSQWSKGFKEVSLIPPLVSLAGVAEEMLIGEIEFVLDTVDRMSLLLIQRSDLIKVFEEEKVTEFLERRARDWTLHTKIAKEAAELFIRSSDLKEIRQRLLHILVHPHTLEYNSRLTRLNATTEAWKNEFFDHITLCVPLIFLMVDWVEIFKQSKK